MSAANEFQARFCPPPEPLRRYFTTFYTTEWNVPDGGEVEDHILPEWANLRIHSHNGPASWNIKGEAFPQSNFPATGPSSQAIRFRIKSSRMWGIGLLPLGWAKFVGIPAAELADRAVDGYSHPAFASFLPLAETLFGDEPDPEGELARITAHFMARLKEPIPDEARILSIHAALVDPETVTVADLVDRAGTSQRTVERMCHRYFGFTPKMLLRRQRFMRSLSDYVVDPSLKWIGAIDSQYHDQAQFVKDFRQFMGMTPRKYAALDKPLLGAVMKERARFSGAAVQTLDPPQGLAFQR